MKNVTIEEILPYIKSEIYDTISEFTRNIALVRSTIAILVFRGSKVEKRKLMTTSSCSRKLWDLKDGKKFIELCHVEVLVSKLNRYKYYYRKIELHHEYQDK